MFTETGTQQGFGPSCRVFRRRVQRVGKLWRHLESLLFSFSSDAVPDEVLSDDEDKESNENKESDEDENSNDDMDSDEDQNSDEGKLEEEEEEEEEEQEMKKKSRDRLWSVNTSRRASTRWVTDLWQEVSKSIEGANGKSDGKAACC